MVQSYRSTDRQPRPRGAPPNLLFRGPSTEQKPDNPLDRDRFYETDTGHMYIFYNGEWVFQDFGAESQPHPGDQLALQADVLTELQRANTLLELILGEL